MEMSFIKRKLSEIIPVLGVKDDLVFSRRGDVTIGWELTMPVAYTVTEGIYDDIVRTFASACRLLPQWTMIHRQDIFTYETYHGSYGDGYLSDAFSRHFDGRRFLTHRQYLYVTMTTKASSMRPVSQTAAFGFRFDSPRPEEAELRQFLLAADEFVSVLTGSGYVKARRLTTEDYEGTGVKPGLIDSYMMLGQDASFRSDIVQSPDSMEVMDKVLAGFKLSDSEHLPGEITNVSRVDELSTNASQLFLSYGSNIGLRLDCEHVVNQYILLPAQGYILQELDKKRKKMLSMSNNAENRVNAEQIQEFIDEVHKDSKLCCFAHMNILVWADAADIRDVKGRVSSALSTMGIVATQSKYDLPTLYLAGVPGGACEVSGQNLMTQELTSMLCMGINETFDTSLEGGTLQVVDRLRHVPIRMDIQKLARSKGLIDNYNVFLLGPSGSGKSFFTNFFARQCYDAGEQIFIIDVGGSYEGLCQIVNEVSCGSDGVYLAWDAKHPFSFNPFIGFQAWVDDEGHLRQDEGGVTFFISFLSTAWAPAGGWSSATMAILETLVRDFILWARERFTVELPVFDDFYQFVVREIVPRIVPEYDEKGNVAKMPENPYLVAHRPVKLEQFDIEEFVRALVSYSLEGAYAFLLNERKPKDIFGSRFTVFEVDKLSEGNALFYSLCVLCIMNAFDMKMRNTPGFKRMIVDEAWKAIANETMAPYLKGLWKTARKFQTSAMVVTQELDDIISSEVIKEAILQNSDTKILLNQSKNANRFGQLSSLMGLDDHQKDMILSMGLAHVPGLLYTDCYIGMNNRYGVYSIEASLNEALAYESDKVKKKPLLDRAEELGSIVDAIDERVALASKGRR